MSKIFSIILKTYSLTMNRKLILAFLVSSAFVSCVIGQEKRSFTFKKQTIEYYFFSNMTPGLTKYPNYQAKVIVVDGEDNLEEYSKSNKIDNVRQANKDKTLYYYFKLPNLKNEKQYVNFLKKFIEQNYRSDFFDRNTVSLRFSDSEIPFTCMSLDDLNRFLSKIVTSEISDLLQCKKAFVVSGEKDDTNLNTSVKYESITYISSIQKRKEYKRIDHLNNWKGNYFLSLTLGNHFIDKNYQSSFDEETLVDINEVNSIWHLSFGHMFSDRLGGLLDFGYMKSNEQSIDIGSLSGTGSGFLMSKLGVGVRYNPIVKKNWSIYGDLKGGMLIVNAAGGSGNIYGIDMAESSESTSYLGMSVGINYRLGKVVFFNSSFEYTMSSFESDIGSISGFTGYTLNFGIGFSFK